METSVKEEQQRKKFLQDVENWSEGKDRNQPMGQTQELTVTVTPPTPAKIEVEKPKPEVPPTPVRKT
jgi:hypothetical protein